MYSNSYCSCSFEPEILKIGPSSHDIHSNNILNLQESTTILKSRTEKVWKLIEGIMCVCVCVYIYIYMYIYINTDKYTHFI